MPASSAKASRPRDKKDIDLERLVIFVGGAVFSALTAWRLGPSLAGSVEALAAAAGVCATFAGFIIAVLTILGDATALLPGSWRVASIQTREIASRFRRLQFIFSIFLCASFSSILMLSLKDQEANWVDWAGYINCFLVVYAFFTSFELPKSLRSIHKERTAAVIESRKGAPDKSSGPA